MLSLHHVSGFAMSECMLLFHVGQYTGILYLTVVVAYHLNVTIAIAFENLTQ